MTIAALPAAFAPTFAATQAPEIGPGGAPGRPPAPTDPFATLLAAASAPAASSGGTAPGTTEAPILPSALTLQGPATGNSVVAEAAQFLGVPYLWGGSSPAQGFDCSGLVQYVFGQLGVAMPRTSEQQAQVGTPVPGLAAAQPGDLLFFEPGQNGAPPGEPGHVAIYAGNGQMIAAPSTGQTVEVQPVPGVPYEIRRVLPATGTPVAGAPVQMGNVSVPGAYAGLIEAAGTANGVPPPLLAALIQTESGFQPGAVSGTGAGGIAQFMPATAQAAGIDPFDPTQAIPAAAAQLGQFHAAFGTWPLALAAYTAGGGAVERAGGIPQDGTTPNYVTTVLTLAGPGGG